jgi:ribonuclease D
MITDSRDREPLVDAVDNATWVALDTESNSLHVYQERVCFIQVCVEGTVFIVDTVALRDLDPLADALASPHATKVLHGADYDVVCLRRDFGITLSPLFDTMIAGQILGLEQLGLGALVSRYFDVELDKGHAKHDWGRRPLESRYIPYLVEDVIFLEELRHHLWEDLEATDRTEEAEIEFERVARQEWSGKQAPDPEGFRKIKGSRDLDQRGLSVLRELYMLREELARDANVPPFRVLTNEQLLLLSSERPRNAAALMEMRPVRGSARRILPRLLDAIGQGVRRYQDVPLRPPQTGSRPPEVQLAVAEGLRQWRRQVTQDAQLPPLVVLPNHVIERLAATRPATLDDLARTPALGTKRLRLYGAAILDIIRDPPPLPRGRRGRDDGRS